MADPAARGPVVPLSLSPVAPVPLLIFGGYGSLRALGVMDPHRALRERWEQVVASEELILDLKTPMKRLSDGALNLSVPDPKSIGLIDEQVRRTSLRTSRQRRGTVTPGSRWIRASRTWPAATRCSVTDRTALRRFLGWPPPLLTVEREGWSSGGQFVDVDNDSHLDIFALSGFYIEPRKVGVPDGGSDFWREVARSDEKYETFRQGDRPLGRGYQGGCSKLSAHVLFDFDRDGWQDIAIVNANAPFLQLFQNQIADRAEGGEEAGILAFRFVGGNHASSPSSDWSNRDGYGAKVVVDLGDRKLLRELRCGDGFAAENSATLIVGLGDAREGKRQTFTSVAAGTLVTVYENSANSPGGNPFVLERYQVDSANRRVRPTQPLGDTKETLILAQDQAPGPASGLKTYVTMATWCPACKGWLPQVGMLASTFEAADLQIYGVPVDEKEDGRALDDYVEVNRPAYSLLRNLPHEKIFQVKKVGIAAVGMETLPTTILTAGDGRILQAAVGVPTVSEIRKWLASERR